MTLKREIKDAYIEGGNSIYVKTHGDAVYVDENETETLTQRLDDIKGKIDNNTSQLKEITNKVNAKKIKRLEFSRDIALTGIQKIALDFKADYIELWCYRQGRSGSGYSACDVINNSQGGFTRREDGGVVGVSRLFYAENGSTNMSGTVKNVDQTGFEIDWVLTGTLTGAGNINVVGYAIKL